MSSADDSGATNIFDNLCRMVDEMEQTPEKAVAKRLLQAVEAGDSQAMFNLGQSYQYGAGVEQNESEAVKWYCRAAMAGNDIGAVVMGGR